MKMKIVLKRSWLQYPLYKDGVFVNSLYLLKFIVIPKSVFKGFSWPFVDMDNSGNVPR